MEPVRSHRNPLVVETAALHRAKPRRDTGRTLIEGPHLLDEALASSIVPEIVFALAEDVATSERCQSAGISVISVTDEAMRRLAGTKSPRGPVAVIPIPGPGALTGKGLLVAWGVGDPGNIGTMIRTAAAFGWDFGHGPGSADPWAPKVLRSAAGTHFRINLVRLTALEDVISRGYEPIAAVVSGGTHPTLLEEGRYAVLVGSEPHGLPESITSEVTRQVTVPMPGGVESLNVGVAAALVLYALTDDSLRMQERGEGEAWV